jgi:tetratricopeptide (TPR) repeat protein
MEKSAQMQALAEAKPGAEAATAAPKTTAPEPNRTSSLPVETPIFHAPPSAPSTPLITPGRAPTSRSAVATAPVALEATPERQRAARRLTAIGRQYSEKGDFQGAIAKFSEAIDADPGLALAFNSRGYARMRVQQWDQAREDFERALALDPNYANASWNLGITLKKLGRKTAGLEYMRKAAQERSEYAGFLAKSAR